MDPATITMIINAGAALAKSVAPLLEDAIDTFGESDAAKIKEAADELFAANEALHDRVQSKLRG